MSPIVRLVGIREQRKVFISIESIPIVLSDLRKSLPELEERLKKKWSVESTHIEERTPYAN